MADEHLDLACQVCEFVGLDDGSDGYFYCQRCGSQAEGLRVTAVENHNNFSSYSNGSQRRASVVKPNPLSQSQPRSQFWENLYKDADDFPATLSYDDYHTQLRMRYIMGLQIMIQFQITDLVQKFNVSPLIVDMVRPIWLRFVASTQVFTDDWLNTVTNESESQLQGEVEIVKTGTGKYKDEPHNLNGRRLIIIWYRSLSKAMPLYCSLAISFLLCHLAREPILPTDIVKWALEGKLSYYAAFDKIEKQIGGPSNACPIESSVMFRPVEGVSIQKLEAYAASIAISIGLELPPVNFYAIASRYLKQLSLPVETILPHACRIYEWSMPSELWLSTNESRLPTRLYVLSILIVSIRILYNIHGFGKWEKSLPCSISKKDTRKKAKVECEEMGDDAESDVHDLDAAPILLVLQSKYNDLIHTSDICKDLEAYLVYCKDVVFAGVGDQDQDESQIIEDFMAYYKDKQVYKSKKTCCPSIGRPFERPTHDSTSNMKMTTLDPKEAAIGQIKSNMKDNNFMYMSPREVVKRSDYLKYTRKKVDGALAYAAHADYYILLRSCARVAQVDVRIMHDATTSFERRLAWLEMNIQHSLKQMPYSESCQFCNNGEIIIECPKL